MAISQLPGVGHRLKRSYVSRCPETVRLAAMLAQRLSVDEGTLAKWEKGATQPTGKRVAVVEQLLSGSPSSALRIEQ